MTKNKKSILLSTIQKFSGVASALYGDKLSGSIITGTQPDNIRLHETWKESVDLVSPDSVHRAFEKLFATVGKAVKLQRTEGTKESVSAAFGTPGNYPHAPSVAAMLRQRYQYALVPPAVWQAKKREQNVFMFLWFQNNRRTKTV